MKKTIFFLLFLFSIGCESKDDISVWVDVDKVTKDDSLTVRSKPSSKSDKVGSLVFDQKYIEVIGDQKVGKSTWLNVKTSSLKGWVNKFYTKNTLIKSFDEDLNCSGTEPFWSLDILSGEATYKDISQQQNRFVVSDVIPSINHNNRWVLSLFNGEQRGEVFLSSTGSCSDDMSDRNYQYDLGFSLAGKQLYTGCCNVIKNE